MALTRRYVQEWILLLCLALVLVISAWTGVNAVLVVLILGIVLALFAYERRVRRLAINVVREAWRIKSDRPAEYYALYYQKAKSELIRHGAEDFVTLLPAVDDPPAS